MTEPLPWVTPLTLRAWLSPEQLSQVAGDEAQRRIDRALSDVELLLTAVPDPANATHRQAMAEAILLTVEQRLTTGDYGSVVGGRISIGHVTYGTDRQGTEKAPPSVPPVALWQLRNAGLLSAVVVAY